MSLKVAIFGSNEITNERIKTCFQQKGWTICAEASDGNQAIDLLIETHPDAMVVDLILHNLDGYAVLDFVKSHITECTNIVLSSVADDKTVRLAMAHGADYFFVKPISPENLVNRLEEFTGEKNEEVMAQKRGISSIDERISDIFLALGVPINNSGFKYMREGVKLAISDPSILDRVTKGLYPRIAENFNTTDKRVERAIRHALERTWDESRYDELTAVFGVRTRYGKYRPTNSEFIALVADRLLLEQMGHHDE